MKGILISGTIFILGTYFTYIKITADGILHDVMLLVRRYEIDVKKIVKIKRAAMYGKAKGFGNRMLVYFESKKGRVKKFDIYTTGYSQEDINQLVLELYRRNSRIELDAFFREVVEKAIDKKSLSELSRKQEKQEWQDGMKLKNFVGFGAVILFFLIIMKYGILLIKSIF